MRYVLMIAGYGWAALGLAMILLSPDWSAMLAAETEAQRRQADQGFFVLPIVVMVLPGLVVGYLGQRL